jgi:predicted dithiol-disulfide oxidoreductase (DUF899 family)
MDTRSDLSDEQTLASMARTAPLGRDETVMQGMGDLHAAVWYRRHDEYDSA